jgi:hypothetical protein
MTLDFSAEYRTTSNFYDPTMTVVHIPCTIPVRISLHLVRMDVGRGEENVIYVPEDASIFYHKDRPIDSLDQEGIHTFDDLQKNYVQHACKICC